MAAFDQVQFVLGDVENIKANLTLQRPLTKIKDAATQEIIGTKTSDVPDLIVLSASLPESPTVQDKASILFRCRRGQAFKGEAPMVWTVSGEKGELRLVAWGGPAINALSYSAPLTIEVHDFATDEVENIEWSFDSWQNELPVFARNVAKMYDNFADGKSADVPTIEDALKRHQQLEEIIVSGYNA